MSIATVVPDLEIHAPDSELHCKACNKDFKNAHAKTMHNVVVHEKRGFIGKMIRNKRGRPKGPKGKLKCPHCSKTFLRATGLGSHMRTHGIKGSSKSVVALRSKKLGRPKGSKGKGRCEPCNKTFKGSAGLAIHNAQVHSTNGHTPNGGKVRANISRIETSSQPEEVNLAFLAGALCERIVHNPRHELLVQLITGRLSTAGLGSS